MALWGISTTTETAANNYAIPKYQHSVDRNRSPWNTFADRRGWIQRWYGTTENSGLSTSYYDEVLVPNLYRWGHLSDFQSPREILKVIERNFDFDETGRSIEQNGQVKISAW